MAQYEDFKKFLKEIEKDVDAIQKAKGIKRTFKMSDIFYYASDINVELHKVIQDRILHYGKSDEELRLLIDEVKNSDISKWMEKSDRESLLNLKIDSNINPYHGVEKVIYKYMREFYGKYFMVKNGEIEDTGLLYYDYENPIESDKKKNYASLYLPVIITPDGKAYFSATHHEELAGYLNASGISVKNGVRMIINHKQHNVSVSSMANFDYTEDSKNDKDILLTDAQARAIAIVYKTMMNKWSKINPANKMVMYSDIFGCGESKNLSENVCKNLKLLDYAFNGEEFSVRGYQRFLKEQLTQFDFDSEWR